MLYPFYCYFINHLLNIYVVYIFFTKKLSRWRSDKESACNVGGAGSTPGSGKFPGEGNGNPLQYFCLGNPMDRAA